MFEIKYKEVITKNIRLSDVEARELAIKYVKDRFGLTNAWITGNKVYRDEQEWRHGSVSTECLGTATEGQLIANKLLELL